MHPTTPDQLLSRQTGLLTRHDRSAVGPGCSFDRISRGAGHVPETVLDAHGLCVQLVGGRSGSQRIDGRRRQGGWSRDAVSLVPAGTAAEGRWADPIDMYAVWFTPEFCSRVLHDGTVRLHPQTMHEDVLLAEMVKALGRAVEGDAPFGRLLRESLMAAIVATLAGGGGQAPALSGGGLAGRRLRSALDYIESHLTEDVSLAEMAGVTGLSERHFCTSFREAMGVPPYRYLVARRIERAREMLATRREATITEIAFAVGFRTSAHFATSFRAVVGSSPTAYRARL